ncbi:MAG: HAD family hydrolase [Lentisphaerae bacterium]|nr:HAD family hydrolase [Lentisphaerota bacterium]
MTAPHHQPCAFLDRDDTLIADRHYLSDPDGVELLPGAAAGLAALRRLGYRLVVVTNQSGVGRGYFTLEDVEAVHRRLTELLAAAGVSLDGIYLCPHVPEDRCDCRKPATGMVERACADLGLDPRRSAMIGDKASDVELARRCGMAAILIETSPGAEPDCRPDARVADLTAAAAWLAAHPRPDRD